MKAKYILSTLGAGLFAMAPQSLLAQANLTWDTADANNTWNTVNSNWTGDAVFANGDNVTFTGAAGEVITVATGGVTAGSFTANHTAGTYAFSGASITGGALTKSGAGVLTFNQTNSFSSISVSAGPSANGTAGTAALVFTVSNALGSTPITLTNTAAMTAINTNAANLIVNNPIALTTANVQTNLLGLSATTQRYNGVISGGNASATLFLNMNTSGSDGVTLFANTANTFTVSRITVNRGVLAIAGAGSLGALTNRVYLDNTNLNGGLRFDGDNINITHPVQFNDFARINVNSRAGAEISTAISGAAGNRTNPYTISGGVLKLSGANTFYHFVDVAAGGTLHVTNASALGTAVGAADRTRVSAGGTLLIDNLTYGSNETLEISGTGVANGGALAATGTSVFNGPVALLADASVNVGTGASLALGGAFTGAFELSKIGAGNVVMSGSSLSSGATRVRGGSLTLTGSMVPAGGFVVSPGAALNLSGLTTPITLATGVNFTAGRATAAATDVTGDLFSGAGNIRVMEGSGIGKMMIAGNLTLNGGTAHFDLSNNPAGANDTIEVSGVLDLNAVTDVSLSLANGSLGNGSYVLAKGASLTGSAASINVLGLPPAGTSRQTFAVSSSTVANALTLDVTGNAASLLWTGATNGNWSTNATDENWNNTTAPDPQDRFFNSDGVTFADRLSPGPQTVTISGDVTPGSVTVNNTAAGTAYTFDSGAITGVTGLLKQGSGLLTITSDTHGFTGPVEIQGGELQALYISNSGLSSSIGAGSSIILNGGKLTVMEATTQSNDRALTIGVNGGALAGADLSTSITYAGPLTGDGNLTIGGAGRIVLSGAGSRAGTTTVETGATLEIAGNATPGAGAFTLDGTLVVNKSVATTIASAISGAGKLEKQGAGTLTLPVANSYAGGTTVAGGALLMLHPSAAGAGSISQTGGSVRFSFGDGTLSTVANDFSLNATGNTTFSVRGTADAAPTQATTVRLTGKISGGAAGQTFNLVDSLTAGNHFNVIELRNANNDFQGTILMNRGTLGFDSDAALGHPDNDIQHFTENLNGSLRFDADNIVLGAGREIIMPPNANARPINTQAFTGTIQGNISGSGILIKQGTGKLILTGTNSNVSVTTVAAGTLQVDGTFATSTGAVTVDATATLGGVGTINRPITVNGTIAPGASVGTLTTAATTINGTYACEVNAATSDVIAATDLILGAASSLVVTDTAGVFPRTIATYSGALTGTFATVTSGFAVDYTTAGQVILRKGGYAVWASQFASSGAASADTDNDGVPNAVEYFMGVNAAGFTSNPAVVNNEITWPKDDTATDASYVVEHSTDLDQWTTATTGVTDSGTEVKYTLPTGEAKYFVRLRVTIVP